MAINNAVRKAKKNEKGNTAKTSSQSKGSVEARKVKSAPLAGFE